MTGGSSDRPRSEKPKRGTSGHKGNKQSQTVNLVSEDDDIEKEASQVASNSRKRTKTRGIASITPSTSSEEDIKRSDVKQDKRGDYKKKVKTSTKINKEELAKLQEASKGKRGRPPTTGEHIQKAAALKADNDERQREAQLDWEDRCKSMDEILNILKRAHLDPEDKAEEAANTPTADLASEVRKAQAEVIRVSNVSRNLQGPLQGALRKEASLTIAYLEELRTRATENDAKSGHDEVRRLRNKVEKLGDEQEKISSKLKEMEEQLNRARKKALDAKKKAEEERIQKDKAMMSLRAAKAELVALKQKITINEEHNVVRDKNQASIQSEPMETETIPVSPPARTTENAPAPPVWVRTTTDREREKWPANRPAIQGKIHRIPEDQCVYNNRDLPPPPDTETTKRDSRVSKARREGKGGTNWAEAELVSETSSLIANEKEHQSQLFSTPKFPALESAPLNKKREPGTKGLTTVPTRAAGRETLPSSSTPNKGNNVTDERRRKKREREKERRRRKRQEEARKREEARTRDEGHSKQQHEARPRSAEEVGPAARTRAKTRVVTGIAAGTPRVQPSPSNGEQVKIRDVPIPPNGWTQVKSRKDKVSAPTYAQALTSNPTLSRSQGVSRQASKNIQGRVTTPGQRQQEETRKQAMKKPPKNAAVQLTCPPGQYSDIMKLARERINIRSLGIEELRPRRARTGALLLEIPGANGPGKADALARELKEALAGKEGVAISRPIKTAEIRLKDVEDSISAAEVVEAVSVHGECQTAEIRVGPIRRGTNGLGTVWVRCPLNAANRLVRKGHVLLGWTRTRIELLPERPTACFRCLQVGHVRAACPSGTDRTGLCYRCGLAGHLARDCENLPRCPLCSGTKRPDNHRVGSQACKAPRKREKKGGPIDRGNNPSVDGRRRREQEPEPMEMGEMELQEPMEIGETETQEPDVTPPPTSQPDWPVTGEGWSTNIPPISGPMEPIIERGQEADSLTLPISGPEGSIIDRERESDPAQFSISGPEESVMEREQESEFMQLPSSLRPKKMISEGKGDPQLTMRQVLVLTTRCDRMAASTSKITPTGSTTTEQIAWGHEERTCDDEEFAVGTLASAAAGEFTQREGETLPPTTEEVTDTSKDGGCPNNE